MNDSTISEKNKKEKVTKPIDDQKLKDIDEGLMDLLSIFEPEKVEDFEPFRSEKEEGALLEASKRVGKALGIKILNPALTLPKEATPAEIIDAICDSSQCRSRLQTLTGDWWTQDCGPMVGFKKEDASPVAFIQQNNKYIVYDPTDGSSRPLNPTIASIYSNTAYRFYKTLPDEPLNWRHLVNFVFGDLKKDFRRILILQFYSGLLGLLLPIVTGIIFDTLIPNADATHLNQIIALLVVATFAGIAFGLSQSFNIMRIRYRSNIAMQSAVWDRVLRLPLPFFSQFLSGDLANRARGIDSIQQFLTSSMLTTLLSGLFSILSLILMFYYDIWLALAGLGLAIIAVLISIGFNLIQLKFQRPLIAMMGKMSGAMYQLLSSVNKLRVANSEKEAFGVWARIFTTKNKLFMGAQMNSIWFGVFYPFFTVFSTIIIFSLVIVRGKDLSFGHFIAFNAAFGQFMGALLSMAAVLNQMIQIIPYYERVKPILKTIPEPSNIGVNPGKLEGNIRIQNLDFRYHADLPMVLENFSLDIKAGSFVALVGPSGCGKSTLFRLLLAFEEIKKHTIYYDSHDLLTLNKKAFRQQLGVVTQNTSLLPGSIFESITALSPNLTMADAEEAAKLVGIFDEIKAMPMGMHTWVAEGGRNISVGQRQRILLAHAIVHKPRILLLDEATSALDNKTQSLIHQNLTALKITRLVSAHRLSMVKDADCIYVMDKGKIVQSGTYKQLVEIPGLFAQLAERQLL